MPNASTSAPPSALAAAAEAGRLVEVVGPSSPARAELDAAARRYSRPLQVSVCGRPGTGRVTLARALRERLSVTAAGSEDPGASGDADLWIQVLTGPPRRADHAILDRLPTDRTIVVLGKADMNRDRADAVAADCATQLDRHVHPVSALLACADVSDVEFGFLCRLADDGKSMPAMVGQFLAGADDERSVRADLLRHVDGYGIRFALAAIRAGEPAGADAQSLTRALRAQSRIGDLVPPIRERVELVRRWRLVELRTRLEVIAARGYERDAIEHLLQDTEVSR